MWEIVKRMCQPYIGKVRTSQVTSRIQRISGSVAKTGEPRATGVNYGVQLHLPFDELGTNEKISPPARWPVMVFLVPRDCNTRMCACDQQWKKTLWLRRSPPAKNADIARSFNRCLIPAWMPSLWNFEDLPALPEYFSKWIQFLCLFVFVFGNKTNARN